MSFKLKILSDMEQRSKRGFTQKNEIEKFQNLSAFEILNLLKSSDSQKRTIAAKLLLSKSDLSCINPLLNALSQEKSLYTKIAICEALANFKEKAVHFCIPYLGKIGSNQYKTLPQKPFLKNNYPLPRDIIARTIGKMGALSIPILIKKLDVDNIEQLSEGIDAIGYISYYEKDFFAKNYILNLFEKYKSNLLISWKLIRAMQSFFDVKVIELLNEIYKNSNIDQHIWEAKRSLKQIQRLKIITD
ncbi:MAG: hypothetical protein JXA94_03625 [Parachlamydiales bacterium]|nr:hypothetical protein [Parachlamydiales bacterium]